MHPSTCQSIRNGNIPYREFHWWFRLCYSKGWSWAFALGSGWTTCSRCLSVGGSRASGCGCPATLACIARFGSMSRSCRKAPPFGSTYSPALCPSSATSHTAGRRRWCSCPYLPTSHSGSCPRNIRTPCWSWGRRWPWSHRTWPSWLISW